MTRRRLINLFLGSSALGAAVSMAYPVFRYLFPPRRASGAVTSVTAARVGELVPNSGKIFAFGSKPALLIFTADGQYRSLTAVCTHLACTVRYEPETESIFCPCHNGRFDVAGNVIGGPPPAPLESYRVDIVGSEIIVSRKD
jgi:cytochrome b6-f complex iron-sulfur subunit